MKTEIEILADEVRQIRAKAQRPRYSPEFIARVLKQIEKNDIRKLADRIGIGKDTLRRWQSQSLDMPKSKSGGEQPTFSPVLTETLPKIPREKSAESAQMIRVDFSYRDGRRMVLEIPATTTSCQDLLASLRQEFFGGC